MIRNKQIGCGIVVGMSICLIVLGVMALFLVSIGFDGFGGQSASPSSIAKPSPTPYVKGVASPIKQSDEQNQPSPTVQESGNLPVQAVVKISAILGGEEIWSGSGTVITKNGLILTNAHVALAEKPYRIDGLLVYFTDKEDKSPQPRYYAEVVQADMGLDLAVLRLKSDLEGKSVEVQNLNLPNIPIGNSDDLHIGAPLIILGYPIIGGSTITLTRGDVAGFTSEEEYGDRAFIKTSATITGGNSGGLAANGKGELVGIPTQMGYGGEGESVDCRPLADTNRDGNIDEYDSCVPGGGFINALRPINLALPLIEAAQRGEVAVGSTKHQERVAESGQLIYEDSFSDTNSGWENTTGPSGVARYLDGKYIIQVSEPHTFVWASPAKNFENVLISVIVQPVSSSGDEDFGILCHYIDNQHFTALEVSRDGYFSIWGIDGRERYSLMDWQPSLLIPTDGSSMTLIAGCTNSKVVLGVNGELLASVDESFPGSGGVGLIAGTWNQGGIAVSFDDFKVYQP